MRREDIKLSADNAKIGGYKTEKPGLSTGALRWDLSNSIVASIHGGIKRRVRVTREEHIAKLKANSIAAITAFKALHGFPAAQLAVMNAMDQITDQGLHRGPCPERLAYALSYMDAICGSYIHLVSDMVTHDHFVAIILWQTEEAWRMYHGILPPPLMVEATPEAHAIAVHARSWVKQGLQKIVAAHPKSSERKSYREHIKRWRKAHGHTMPAAAKVLGVSESQLKSICSDKGQKRYSDETLSRILEETTLPEG